MEKKIFESSTEKDFDLDLDIEVIEENEVLFKVVDTSNTKFWAWA